VGGLQVQERPTPAPVSCQFCGETGHKTKYGPNAKEMVLASLKINGNFIGKTRIDCDHFVLIAAMNPERVVSDHGRQKGGEGSNIFRIIEAISNRYNGDSFLPTLFLLTQ